ncbi:MAG: tetratricopeptide repeat protein [Planctomycetes bacterium]|nr:tetratricopeptide repeat protein [Planctomycetota bacterium]
MKPSERWRWPPSRAVLLPALLALEWVSLLPADAESDTGEAAVPPEAAVDPRAYAAFAAGVTARLRGDDSAAMKQFRTALKFAPGSSSILREVADLYMERGEVTRAIEIYRKVLDQWPRDLKANRELGRIYFRQKKAEEAIRHLRIVTEEQPDDILIRFLLATLYKSVDQPDACVREYEAVLRIRPHLVRTSEALKDLYRELPRPVEALREEESRAAPDDFIPRFRLAQALLEAQKPDEAVRVLESAVKIEPNWSAGLETLGKLYEAEGKAAEAIDAYVRAAVSHPSRTDLLYHIAELHLQSGRTADAARELEKVRAVQPTHEDTLYRLTYCYHELKQYEASVGPGEEYLRHREDRVDPHIYELLGTAYAALGRSEKAYSCVSALRHVFEESPRSSRSPSYARMAARVLGALGDRRAAIQALEEALEHTPDHLEVRLDLAALYDQEGMENLAEEVLRTAFQKTPNDPRVNNHLGYFLAEKGRNLEEAAVLIQNALRAEPRNWAYLDSLGWVYFRQGRTADALEKLQEAITIHEDSVLRAHLGDVFQALNEPEKAVGQWRRALELDPRFEKVRQKLEALPPRAR